MSTTITNLSALSSEDVLAIQEQLRSSIESLADGQLDLRRGVVHDLVLHLHAILLAAHFKDVDRYMSARSLLDISRDETLADPAVVDAVLSNYGIARGEARAAAGEVIIVVRSPNSVTIGAGAVFTVDSTRFVTEESYTAKLEAAQAVRPTDRLLTPHGVGLWRFAVPVVAAETGVRGNIRRGTLLTPENVPTAFVTAFAAGDFTGGADVEPTSAMLSRMRAGMAVKAPGSRLSYLSMLRGFGEVISANFVGFGDAEMRRDRHTLWPGSTGGRVDAYVRTQAAPVALTAPVTARLVSKTSDSGVWACTLADELPGFYEVRAVLPGGEVSGSLTVISEQRGMRAVGTTDPDIVTAEEASFSAYQTAVVTFSDPLKDYSGLLVGDEAEYQVVLVGMPGIGDLQRAITAPDYRALASDTLIKAPVPCFVSFSIIIHKSSAQSDPDVAAIRAAVVDAVHAVGFTGRLAASTVYSAITARLEPGMNVGLLQMSGRILRPDGTPSYVSGQHELIVPIQPEAMVSDKTVQFFTQPESIGVDVRSVIPAQV